MGISTNNLNTDGLNRAGNGRCQPIDSCDEQGQRPMAASAIRLNTMDHNPTKQKTNKTRYMFFVPLLCINKDIKLNNAQSLSGKPW